MARKPGRYSKKPGIRDRFAYMLDKLVRKSATIQLLALLLFSLILVIMGAFLLSVVTTFNNFSKNLWWSFLRLTDPGYLGDDHGKWRALVGTVVIMTGLVIFGLLISIITTAFQERLESIKKGRRFVFEKDHAVILGWGNVALSVIEEMLNEKIFRRDKPPAVAVLTEKSREEIEDDVEKYLPRKKSKKVICRSGELDNIPDLMMVNLPHAREIMIVSNDDGETGDARTVKALYSVIKTFGNNEGDFSQDDALWEHGATFQARIALQVKNRDTANILKYLDEKNPHLFIHVINQYDFIARIMAQSCLQPGLERVYREILSFQGNEIYLNRLHRLGQFENCTFEDILYAFPDAIPVGYVKDRNIILNPDHKDKTPLEPYDFLVYLSSGYSLKTGNSLKPPIEVNLSDLSPLETKPLKILVVGEGAKLAEVVRHLLDYVPDGSEIIHTHENLGSLVRENVTVEYTEDDGSLHSHCQVISKNLPADMVLLVDTEERKDTHDAETLLKVTKIKKEQESLDKKARIVAEFYEQQSADLAGITDINVMIVSNQLLSHYLVQTLKEPRRAMIFEELLSPEGSEICLLPLDYFVKDTKVTFLEILHASRKKGKLAIGCMSSSGDLLLNPKDKNAVAPPDSRIVCLGKIKEV